MNQSTYFCDYCYKEDHNQVKTFFNRYKKTDYTRHLKTNKHLKTCLKVQEDENSILCKECNTLFSPDGYEVHRKRNQEMWEMTSWTRKELKLTCNNIVIDGKRFGSIGIWSKWLDLQENKIKQKRKGKKSISYTTTELPPPTYEESESEKEEKEEEVVLSDYDERCGEKPTFKELCEMPLCGLPQNDEGYSSFHLDKWDIDVCRCCDTTDEELEVKVI